MSRIDDFIAQGILPFAGREEEKAKILNFWRSVPEAQHLRVMLLVAEAGMGKSRLLEECLSTIRSERGVVVHVKLYPEAANSLAALLSRSIWTAPSGREILRSQPGENIPDVVNALQRLCRLRPTLLVLEDVHLFPSESIPDLVRLFEALVDETISVLCLSRPTSFAAQGILERYLVELIRMEGLRPEGLAQLWTELFGSPPSNDIVERLHTLTKGNGLAIRSGLRGVVQNGALRKDQHSGQWKLSDSLAAFEQGLRRSVSLVAEGMVAHLGREKREVIEQLAALGEVFARETAIGLDKRAERMLNDLIEQGIIVETLHPVAPLAGIPIKEPGKAFIISFPQSDHPLLAFTHSLLHDYLAARRQVNGPALMRVIAEDYPLYSLVPLRLFETLVLSTTFDTSVAGLVLKRLQALTQLLDRTAQWRDAVDLLRPLNNLLEHLEADPEPTNEEKLRWRMQIQHASLSILRRSLHSPEWIALHNRQLETTRNATSYEIAQFRMLAKSFEVWRIGFDKDYGALKAIVNDVDLLIAQYPQLAHDISYIYTLESVIEKAFSYADHETMGHIDRLTQELLDSAEFPAGARQVLVERILPNLLYLFETDEERRKREESIRIIEEYRTENNSYYGMHKVYFLCLLGQLHEALPLSEAIVQGAKELGLWINTMSTQEFRIIIGSGIGYPLPLLVEETNALLHAARKSENLEALAIYPQIAYSVVTLFTEQFEELAELTVTEESLRQLSPALYAVVALWRGQHRAIREVEANLITRVIHFNRKPIRTWKDVAAIPDAEVEHRREEILSKLLLLLDEPILQLFDILTVRGTLHLWRSMFGQLPSGVLKASLIRGAIARLEWLQEREIWNYMGPLVILLEEFQESVAAEKWKKIVEEGKSGWSERVAGEPVEGKIRISVLGAIRVAIPSEEFVPVRGVRIRTLLGLMTADRMIATPLSAEEFLSLAGGHESDPEHARKKKNMAVVRLREIVGHDAILTDGPTPQFNPALVSVDLLEIDDLLRRALHAARHNAFVRALPLIEEALNRCGGEVPFPTLYENFFEAARNDFEYRLRRAIIEIGEGMIGMGDAAGAEPFLRRAFQALPGDEDIADLLRRTLEGTGNRIEAERIRMRAEQV